MRKLPVSPLKLHNRMPLSLSALVFAVPFDYVSTASCIAIDLYSTRAGLSW